MLDVCMVVYLDDILIYSDNMEDHVKHIWEVLQCLRQHKLFAKPKKCEFHSDSVEYLGYFLSPDSLTMSQDKVTAICDWPKPCKVKDIQSFLGFVNFYCRFIFNYSHIVVQLTRLTRKDAPWNFSKDSPILTHYQPGTLITIKTNASDYVITGILSITCSNGEIQPVTFYSFTLTMPKLNYDMHDKELLAIFKAFKTW
ncbi:hypothetical protein SCLCIDRAFT_28375 [Scleroderma citrinum Foug A]|uniref:Reverse transcriptase domain-containing protein n=1 Tax=Scleroderma citrinum Foug A TaxID=1036808 RepID=A0A0C3DBN0_9AGAM|nr:hypothetical protein SCLCIDRAFT_28375 [Scleroderma citrinum Foug A]